jgi:hypothetical protein
MEEIKYWANQFTTHRYFSVCECYHIFAIQMARVYGQNQKNNGE